jgi:chromosome segregation ATPase
MLYIFSISILFFSSNLFGMEHQMIKMSECETLIKKVIHEYTLTLPTTAPQSPSTSLRTVPAYIANLMVIAPAKKIGVLRATGLAVSSKYVNKQLQSIKKTHEKQTSEISQKNSIFRKEMCLQTTAYNLHLSHNCGELTKKIDSITDRVQNMQATIKTCKVTLPTAQLLTKLENLEKEVSWFEEEHKVHIDLRKSAKNKENDIETSTNAISTEATTLNTSAKLLLSNAKKFASKVKSLKKQTQNSLVDTKKLTMALTELEALLDDESAKPSISSSNQPE